MTEYAFVVKKGDRYLADPFHHTQWTPHLLLAKLFLLGSDAQRTAGKHKGAEPVLVALEEVGDE